MQNYSFTLLHTHTTDFMSVEKLKKFFGGLIGAHRIVDNGSSVSETMMITNSTRVGMVKCEHCGRQFNPHSGARHIPWCAKQQSENRKHRLSAEKKEAFERYKWRISYRPSNQLTCSKQQQQQQRALAFAGNIVGQDSRVKKSSVNSSATLSSPSASSISIASGSDTANQRPARGQSRLSNVTRQQPQQQRPHQPAVGQLKRSISSLTLTKQKGVTADKQITHSTYQNGRFNSDGPQQDNSQQQRTKSVSDLTQNRVVNEMVENLTKRMDQIFAQNQILLASFSRSAKTASILSDNNSDTIRGDYDHDDDDDDDDDDQNDYDDGIAPRATTNKCHHCRSNYLAEANYCHKCGCKLQATSSNSNSPD